MASRGVFTYSTLQREIKKRLLDYFLTKGYGGPLVFIGVVGGIFLWLVLKAPFFALLVTGICLAAGGMMLWECWRSQKIRNELVRTVVSERFRSDNLLNEELKETITQSITYFTEIVKKIVETSRIQGANENFSHVLQDADQMLALQFESAEQIKEFKRILSIIEHKDMPNGKRKTKAVHGEGALKLRGENVQAIQETISEAEASVVEINQKLETLMLQVAQMDKKASDLVRTAEFAEETTDTLKRLQAVVNARRETADEFIRRFTPERVS